MSIQAKLKQRKKERAELEAKARAELEARRQTEHRLLPEAVSVIQEQLRDFKVTVAYNRRVEAECQLTVDLPYKRNTLQAATRPGSLLYVTVGWKTRVSQSKRFLEIKVGMNPDTVSFCCSPSSFEEMFIRHIEGNYVV